MDRYWDGKFHLKTRVPLPRMPALGPRVALLREDMLGFEGNVSEIRILNGKGAPVKAKTSPRRFFEAAWMHVREGVYYFSYSTGDTHEIVYATGGNPRGPFTYRGVILKPVIGWTTHHSIVKVVDTWYLFFHDSTLSGGVDALRCLKLARLYYNSDGTIQPIEPSKDMLNLTAPTT